MGVLGQPGTYRRSIVKAVIVGHLDDSLVPPGGWVLPPRVVVTKQEVRYRLYGTRERSRDLREVATAQASGELLDRFLALDTADKGAMTAFVNEWGPLELCEQHGLPTTHNFPSSFHDVQRLWVGLHRPEPPPLCLQGQWTDSRGSVWRSDPLAVMGLSDGEQQVTGGWRRLIDEARVLADLAAITVGRTDMHPVAAAAALGLAACDARTAFAWGLQRWETWAQLRPWWHFPSPPRLAAAQAGVRRTYAPRLDRLQDGLFPETLVGGIVLALVQLHRAKAGQLTVDCAGCAQPHFPVNPQRGNDSYCRACRDTRVRERNADRRYRERRRAGMAAGPRGGKRRQD